MCICVRVCVLGVLNHPNNNNNNSDSSAPDVDHLLRSVKVDHSSSIHHKSCSMWACSGHFQLHIHFWLLDERLQIVSSRILAIANHEDCRYECHDWSWDGKVMRKDQSEDLLYLIIHFMWSNALFELWYLMDVKWWHCLEHIVQSQCNSTYLTFFAPSTPDFT